MYYLTNNGSNWKIRFQMRSFPGECRYAEYSTFKIGPESDGYRLTIGGYSGDAGGMSLFFELLNIVVRRMTCTLDM
jgi:hypothetical protein